MLKIDNIYKTFNAGTVNEKVSLNGVSLHLREGESIAVIGGNGAGKSTLMNAVSGSLMVDEGTIHINGVDVTHLPEHKRAKFIGRVFQDPMMGTAATMQIEENMALAARRGRPRGLRIGITKAEREEYRELLKLLDFHGSIITIDAIGTQTAIMKQIVEKGGHVWNMKILLPRRFLKRC